MPAIDGENVSEATNEAEAGEAAASHGADRGPTSDEERAAETSKVDPDVAKSFANAAERGANDPGEGRIA